VGRGHKTVYNISLRVIVSKMLINENKRAGPVKIMLLKNVLPTPNTSESATYIP
jgi:hypothetical protein